MGNHSIKTLDVAVQEDRRYCLCYGCHHPIDLYGCNGFRMTQEIFENHKQWMEENEIQIPESDFLKLPK
jgi:hypothetical protein